jgi:hypothetical protein
MMSDEVSTNVNRDNRLHIIHSTPQQSNQRTYLEVKIDDKDQRDSCRYESQRNHRDGIEITGEILFIMYTTPCEIWEVITHGDEGTNGEKIVSRVCM